MAKTDYYEILGVPASASQSEIQRAYRTLARRYHPDVNPGSKTDEKFKTIAEAYRVLKDPAERRKYDLQFDRFTGEFYRQKLKNYAEQAKKQYEKGRHRKDTSSTRPQPKAKTKKKAETKKTRPLVEIVLQNFGASLGERLRNPLSFLHRKKRSAPPGSSPVSSISIIELSLTVEEAVSGVKKNIEVAEPEGERKVSVHIPPGARSGSVIRLRNKKKGDEEILLIVQLVSHPFLSIERRGLVIELPITVEEALRGASISVPTLDDAVMLKIPAGSQSGSYVRLNGQGIKGKDGERGDLFYRLMIRNPEPPEAVGLADKVGALTPYYSQSVRNHLPKQIG